MNFKLLVLSFLIVSLAVAPAFAQPVFRIHTDKAINIPETWVTYYFGGGIYIYLLDYPIRVTHLFETDAPLSWFNYTVAGASSQDIFNSALNISALYVNNVAYNRSTVYSQVWWAESFGLVHVVLLAGTSYPANVSLAYGEAVEPPVFVALEVEGYDENGTYLPAGSQTAVFLSGPDGNSTLSIPFIASVRSGYTYTLTAIDAEFWTFNNWSLAGPWRTISITPVADTLLDAYYDYVPAINWMPVPIIFIIGMVGLGCMFVGPTYGIRKMMAKEYRDGLVWGTIITALGFALFIAWLFGGNF